MCTELEKVEIKVKKKENNWYIPKILALWVSAIAIPASTLIFTNQQTRKQSQNYAYELDLKKKDSDLQLMTFFLNNYEKFFSSDPLVVSNIANVVAVLDTSITKDFYDRLNVLLSEQNKKIFNSKKIVTEKQKFKQEIWFLFKADNSPLKNTHFRVDIEDNRYYEAITDEYGIAKIEISGKFNQELEHKIFINNIQYRSFLRKVVCIDIGNK